MSISLLTDPIVFSVIDPANVVEGEPAPTPLDTDPNAPTPYFTFNENNQDWTEAPNFAPVELEPAEEGDDISPVIIDPVE